MSEDVHQSGSEPISDRLCFVFRNPLGRWVIGNVLRPGLAWSGSRWVPHHDGLPAGDAQVSNWESREAAWKAADALRLAIALFGCHVDDLSITCFQCGLISFHPEDVHNRYCGNCHVFHGDEPTQVYG
jgi:hypothetical protein